MSISNGDGHLQTEIVVLSDDSSCAEKEKCERMTEDEIIMLNQLLNYNLPSSHEGINIFSEADKSIVNKILETNVSIQKKNCFY